MYQIHLQGNKKKGQKTRMPMCDYGSACNRKTCVYRHPPKGLKTLPPTAKPVPEGESRPICVHFLSGSCSFGSHCANLHIYNDIEQNKILERVSVQPCRFGSECKTYGCLYSHSITTSASNITTTPVAREVFVKPDPPVFSIKARPFIPSVAAPAFVPAFLQPVLTPCVPEAVFKAPTREESENLKPKQTFDSRGKEVVKIPTEIWLTDVERNPGLYNIHDPIIRYNEVNQPYEIRNAEVITSPIVIDLHFQTAISCMQVLDGVLSLKIDEAQGRKQDFIWIITGSGHHTDTSGNAPGKLFKIVKVYLDTLNQYEYSIGKDGNSFVSAFRLKVPKL